MLYRTALSGDGGIITDLAVKLWGEQDVLMLRKEFERLLSEADCAVFLALDSMGQAVGFAQCQLRHDYVEGTQSSPVGYLEGIYVSEDFRKQGCARELLNKCERWAKEKGCTEFASDCELHNDSSYEFHLRIGFSEANRIICFTKKL